MTSQTITPQVEIETLPIPTEILQEIEAFEEEANRLIAGEGNQDIFKPFRLQHGIYGQRQPGVQMVRIKIPFGGLSANQVRRIGELADTYATGVGHVTTRQDIQLHFALLKDIGTIMRKLAEVGLTTREACANTVRNVTACHLAGVCQGEVFDVTPYAKTVATHLLRNPLNQSLPRKFKIAFSGCQQDCALTPIHDVGLIAVKRQDGTHGFRMTVGGGLGSAPRMGKLFREFVPMNELLPTIEAVIKVFDTLGNRKNRHKARMKFVIDKLGFEEFQQRWTKAYAELGYAEQVLAPMEVLEYQDNPVPLIMPTSVTPKSNGVHGNGQDKSQESPFRMWKRTNVVTQKQPGYVAVGIKLPMGDITTNQMYLLADLAERFSNGNVRTTINQNVIIRWVPETQVEAVYGELVRAGLGDPGAELVEDIIACPGTDTCGLGITSSKGIARALAEIFPPGRVPEDLKDVTVKISGCHNSCAQHHIATIGLHGVGKRLDDHIAPHYELHLGGGVNGDAHFGKLIVKLPAKNVPDAISHLLTVYRRDRTTGESLQAFVIRKGKVALKEELIPYTILPEFSQDASYYFDWEGEEEFTLEDLGPGECAGGALEMIDDRMLEAEQELYHARLLSDKQQYSVSLNKAYRAVIAGAKALLVTKGVDPATDGETFSEFERLMVSPGLVPDTYKNLGEEFGGFGPKETTVEFATKKMAFARDFLETVRKTTERLSQELNLTADSQTKEIASAKADAGAKASLAATETAPKEAVVYDLRGVACPLNYVKTKLKLEMMDVGDRLEVWLDAGDPIKNVPMSLRNDGQHVLSEEPFSPEKAHFKVLVEKAE